MSGESEHPEVQWALDILAPSPYQEPLINRYICEIYGAILGFAYGCAYNALKKRPYLATLPKHIVLSVIGAGIGTLVGKYRNEKRALKDAALRDYIIRHPEDFPQPVRKKWSEVFEEWVPRR